jgi:hypothetical protein
LARDEVEPRQHHGRDDEADGLNVAKPFLVEIGSAIG